MLLNDRHLLGRHLDAKIATRDHHAVGDLKYLLEVLNGLRLLQLCDHPHVAAIFADFFPHCLHVRRGADERDGDHVHAMG